HLHPDQRRGGRVSDQLRRPRPTDQRSRRALRPARHLCGDLFRHSGQRLLLHFHRKGRAMAETGRLSAVAPGFRLWGDPVLQLRIAIIVAVLVVWETVAASGLLYRDVVPSLLAIGRALVKLLSAPEYYWNLGVTAGEVGTSLVI